MEKEPLLPEEERKLIAEEATERGESSLEYAQNLLEKGKQFEEMSRSLDQLVDEIRQVRKGNREISEIQLPSELGAETRDPALDILKPYLEIAPDAWEKVAEVDRCNIAQYALFRNRQGAESSEISHEVGNLIRLAIQAEKPVSNSKLKEFDEPANRQGRPLDRFLFFIGNHQICDWRVKH